MSAVPAIKLVHEAPEGNPSSHEPHDLWTKDEPTPALIRKQLEAELADMIQFVEEYPVESRFHQLEQELIRRVFRLGRLLVALFLCVASQRLDVPLNIKRGRKEFRRQPSKPRLLGTFFGKVRYWRAYMHQITGRGGGYYPLDMKLGLTADGFSLGVLSRAAQLATKISFAASVKVMSSFMQWSPSPKVVEQSVLGLGAYTTAWFEKAGPPVDDGDVLIIQIDSKAPPTATLSELRKRRGKRRPEQRAPSPRHRGRYTRSQRAKKKRRKKGDKSKNGRMTTVVVMYTLQQSKAEDGSPLLLGPINHWVYASFAPKRHAFAIARREADKRGFGSDSGRLIQIVTDGDEDLERYAEELFPEAIHTLDIIHAIERLWKAGACLYKEGSAELEKWVEVRKAQLYAGQIGDLLVDLEGEYQLMRPGKKRDRFEETIKYLGKREHMMNYDELAAQDLELASGAVEGAVRYVVSQRFDEGGMRWIRERAEALLQLRCIEINGDWDDFIAFVHDDLSDKQGRRLRPDSIQRKSPKQLPDYGVTR